MRIILVSLQFLTRFPITLTPAPSEREMAASAAFFPLAGLIVGGSTAVVHLLLARHLPDLIRAGIMLSVYLLTTGGMHLDGFVDTIDGLSSSHNRERALSVMRDSRIGAIGAAALIAIVLMRFSLYAVALGPPLARLLVTSSVCSRWGMVLGMGLAPYARTGQGLARPFVEAPGRSRVLVATALALALVSVVSGPWGLAALGCSGLIALVFTRTMVRRIGGITGDTLGALNEVSEVATLLLLVFGGGLL